LLPHFLLNPLDYLGEPLGNGLAGSAGARGGVFICRSELSV
jgi:hypothetical protein